MSTRSTASYRSTSPWANTNINSLYLDLLSIRPIPAEPDDFQYTIENQYKNRPDLLSHDLYQSPKLWWVFTQRNMDILRDPIYDFEPGVTIYIPKKTNLQRFLGI